MPTLLIADNTKDFREALTDALSHDGPYPEVFLLNIAPSDLADLLRSHDAPPSEAPQVIIRHHLLQLNFSQKRKGFQQLCIGVPLFAQDPNQLLSKEIYPAIAKACGGSNTQFVERTIRTAIKEAWHSRSPDVWEQYFPGYNVAPSNKQFICTLAQLLR